MNRTGQPLSRGPWNRDSRDGGEPEQDRGAENDFSRVLDEAFNRLMEKKAELSVKKIRELEKLLASLERELDGFLAGRFVHGVKTAGV